MKFFCFVVKSKTFLILTIVLGEKIKDNQIGEKEFEDDATCSTLHPHLKKKKIIFRTSTYLKGKYLEAKATEKSDLSVTDSTECHAM